MKATLTLLRGTIGQGVQTRNLEGETFTLPAIGNCFMFFYPSLENENADIVLIRTTPIEKVKRGPGPDNYEFSTKNSTYKLRLLKESSTQ